MGDITTVGFNNLLLCWFGWVSNVITAALQMTPKCVSVIFRRLFSELPTVTFKIKFLENKTAALASPELLLIIASGITFSFFLNIYFFFFFGGDKCNSSLFATAISLMNCFPSSTNSTVRIQMNDLVRICCYNPAHLFNLCSFLFFCHCVGACQPLLELTAEND